jgi:hypothetical protein
LGRLVVVTTGAAFTTIDKAWSSNTPFVSVTRTVKLNVPVAVGVPEITPVPLFKERPAGNAPTVTDQLNGVVPPLAASVWLYAAVSVAPGRLVVVTTGAALTTIDNACSSNTPFASVTRTVKFEVPATVGVPLITPVPLFRLRPAGSDPTVILHVNGAAPPVAAKV